MNNIIEGLGMLDGGWLTDNISCKVGGGSSTLFWKDPWLEGMFSLGWGSEW